MKKIEDYIHLYIGCDVQWTRSDGAKLISKLTLSDAGWLKRRDDVKLLLRPLSSITKEEAIMLADIIHPESKGNHPDDVINDPDLLPSVTRNLTANRAKFYASVSFEMTRFLLSKSFDIFGLIDANFALDATKIEKV